MRKIDAFAVLSLFVAFGCAGLKPRELTIEDKVALVRNTASLAAHVALTEIYKDPAERNAAAELVKRNTSLALGTLGEGALPPGAVDLETYLLEQVPPRFRVYAASAWSIFRTYYAIPSPGEAIGADNAKLARAFLEGLREGCETAVAQ